MSKFRRTGSCVVLDLETKPALAYEFYVVDAATGCPVLGVRYADDETGMMRRLKFDGGGQIVYDGHDPVIETVHQRIKILRIGEDFLPSVDAKSQVGTWRDRPGLL